MKPFSRSFAKKHVCFSRTGALFASTALTVFVALPAHAADVDGVVTHTADFNYADTLQVGNAAAGTMIVENGADVRNTDAFVGASAGAASPYGEVIVRGPGSAWYNSAGVVIGHLSDGSLQVLDQGLAEVNGLLTIGGASGAGTVMVDGASVLAIWNGDLRIGDTSAGSLTLTNDSTANVDGGAGDIILGSSYAAGEITIGTGGGSLLASVVRFGNTASTLTFDHGLASYNFDTDLSGDGQLIVDSGTTVLGGNAAAFSGATYVNGGSLLLDGVTLGSMASLSGGVFGGTGTLSGVLYANSGSTLSPGSDAGIGQLNVGGSVTLYSGSNYTVHVDNAGNADKVVSGGSIDIRSGVTLDVYAQNGTDDGSTYNASTTYTILEGGSLTGSFDTVNENFAYLDADVTYDATKAYLRLARCIACGTFASLATTPNQTGVANAVESQGNGTLYNAVLALPTGEPGSAFEKLSGEVHSSTRTGVLDRSRLTRDGLSDRLRSTFGGVGTGSAASAYAEEEKQEAMPILAKKGDRPVNVWMSGYGAWNRYDGNGNGHGTDVGGGGVLFGADAGLENGWRLGFAGGYGSDHYDQNSLSSSADVDTYQIAAYGGRQIGPLGLRFGAAYGLSEIDASRTVDFTGFSDELTADYDARTAQAFAEAAWRIDRDLLHIEPFANLAYVNVDTDGFTEKGGAAALSVDSENQGQWQQTLGVRLDRDFAVNGMLGKVKGSLGWRHVYGDTISQTAMAFGTGDGFTTASAGSVRNTAMLGAGVELAVSEKASFSLDYSGQFGEGTSEQYLSGTFGVKF
jgi:outer membrane autotransporter protein